MLEIQIAHQQFDMIGVDRYRQFPKFIYNMTYTIHTI